MKHTKITKRKISEKLKGRKLSIETIEKMIGRTPWNKGISTKSNGSLEKYMAENGAWNKGVFGSKTGEKNGMWKGGLPLCMDCKQEMRNRNAKRCIACYRLFNKGENHYAWKGGIGQPYRRTGEYKQWRMGVFRRDWFTCQMPVCGYKGKDIQAHHIIPCRVDDSLVYNNSNGITLCKNCHIETRWKEEEFEELFTNIVQEKMQTTAAKGLVVWLEYTYT